MTTPAPINTRQVSGRRTLYLTEPLAAVWEVSAAARAGRLTPLGNWSAGCVLGHLAAWIDYGFDGYPSRPPWYVKMVLRLMKSRFFGAAGSPAGVRISGAPAGTFAREELTVEEGERRFVLAWERLRAGPPPDPHPIFGRLTHDQWSAMQLAHGRLHLSFLEIKWSD